MTTKDSADTATGGGGEDILIYYPLEPVEWNTAMTFKYTSLVYWVSGAKTADELDNCRFGPSYGTMLHLSSSEFVVWRDVKNLPKHLRDATAKAKAYGDVLEPAVRRDLDTYPELIELFKLQPIKMQAAFNQLDHTKLTTFDVAGRWEWVDRVDKEITTQVRVDEDEAATGTAAPLLRKIMGKPASRRKRK